MINTKEALVEWHKGAQLIPTGQLTLDLEADSLHRYQEKLCLIQYADKNGCQLIDPLAIEDMSLFAHWLSKQEVWMHGADYDMSLFMRAFQCLPLQIWDTQIAARLLGHPRFGLSHLVEHYYGVELSKSSQKADWSKRPLSPTMLEYAQNDVRYMLGMAEQLCTQLKEKGRWDWFVESCQNAQKRFLERYEEDTDKESWRIQGSGKLDSRGLAALRHLWNWRDEEARLWDKPSFMVCSNADLLNWSALFQSHKTPSASPRFVKGRLKRFQTALQELHELNAKDYPQRQRFPKRRKDEEFEAKLAQWMEKRSLIAENLGIDPSLIAPKAILEGLVHDEEKTKALLMNWQKDLLFAKK